jgi:hypothetical protein
MRLLALIDPSIAHTPTRLVSSRLDHRFLSSPCGEFLPTLSSEEMIGWRELPQTGQPVRYSTVTHSNAGQRQQTVEQLGPSPSPPKTSADALLDGTASPLHHGTV